MGAENSLMAGAFGFVVAAVILMIGGSVLALTTQAAVNATAYPGVEYNGTVNYTNVTMVTDLGTSTGNTLTTFGNFLPIIAIAIVGGIAVGAMIQFGGFTSRG